MVKVAVGAGGQLLPDGSGGITEWVKAEDLERMESYVDYGPQDAAGAERGSVRHLLTQRRRDTRPAAGRLRVPRAMTSAADCGTVGAGSTGGRAMHHARQHAHQHARPAPANAAIASPTKPRG